MAKPIHIIADVSSTNPGLGFQEYAEALADAIRGGNPPQFTIGLYGAWGSGKSSLVNAIANILDQKDSKVIPVIFDAWRYEKFDYIIVPLLHKVYNAIERRGLNKILENLKRALASIVFSLNFNIGVLGLSTKDIKDAWGEAGLTPLDNAFSKPFAELEELSKAMDSYRIAVLVDDLDRCSPEKVVSVLESIKLVMDVPGFIFVLALDFDVLIEAVKTKYPHAEGDVFIQKVIQLPFRVPPLNTDSPSFIDELIPGWPKIKASFPSDSSDQIRDIAQLGLQSNPRQIKRLINSYLLLERVIEQRNLEINRQLLLPVIGLQLRWPSYYSDFQDAVMAEDKDPFQNFAANTDEPELQNYSKRFFTGKIDLPQLKQLVQLTTVVVIQEKTSEELQVSLSASREPKREEFIAGLKNMGFEKSQRSDRLYYNPDIKNIRFVIGKHVIRFEKEDRSGDWRLKSSYLITRETGDALKVAGQYATRISRPAK